MIPGGERGGLVVNASDSVSRGRDSSPTRVKPCCVLEQGTSTPQKVLVIPRKRWLHHNMTAKLLTGTLRINQPMIPGDTNICQEYESVSRQHDLKIDLACRFSGIFLTTVPSMMSMALEY